MSQEGIRLTKYRHIGHTLAGFVYAPNRFSRSTPKNAGNPAILNHLGSRLGFEKDVCMVFNPVRHSGKVRCWLHERRYGLPVTRHCLCGSQTRSQNIRTDLHAGTKPTPRGNAPGVSNPLYSPTVWRIPWRCLIPNTLIHGTKELDHFSAFDHQSKMPLFRRNEISSRTRDGERSRKRRFF